MQFLTLSMIVSVMLADFLVEALQLPAPLKLLPEAFAAITVVFVVILGMTQRFRFVRTPYWLVFGTLAIIILSGLIINAVAPGPVLAGIRLYLRAIPFFFLPAVYAFSERQIRQQMLVLLILALVQVPLAISQRLTIFGSGHFSGDKVFGTLMISSVLSMFLISAACVATGAFMRGRLSKPLFIGLFFILLIPTTINETKGTLVLLPIALFTTLMTGAKPAKRLAVGLAAIALLAGFFSIFVPVYDYYNTKHNPYPLTLSEFFSDQGKMQHYLDKNAGVGAREDPGRVDAITVPLRYLSHDLSQLAFGLGVGNASRSVLGPQFSGQYMSILGIYSATTSASAFLLEIGLVGTILVILLYWLIFSDARVVARQDPGLTGSIAVGWSGITALITLATFYKSIHLFSALTFLFWYFSGLVAAKRMRLAYEKPASAARTAQSS